MDNWKRGAGMPGATGCLRRRKVTIQAGFNTLLFGAAGSEAYDEPLTGGGYTAIASLFIVA
jgi:hypothetical protein